MYVCTYIRIPANTITLDKHIVFQTHRMTAEQNLQELQPLHSKLLLNMYLNSQHGNNKSNRRSALFNVSRRCEKQSNIKRKEKTWKKSNWSAVWSCLGQIVNGAILRCFCTLLFNIYYCKDTMKDITVCIFCF